MSASCDSGIRRNSRTPARINSMISWGSVIEDVTSRRTFGSAVWMVWSVWSAVSGSSRSMTIISGSASTSFLVDQCAAGKVEALLREMGLAYEVQPNCELV